jgi:nitrate/TMAO reductase-like tetraheme cytochrome c subunit
MKSPVKSKKVLILSILVGLVVLGLVFSVSGFAYAASQETQDTFCASCHTQPESTFYERSISGSPEDLASFHSTHDTRCIDCHSGKGVIGRVQAELMGARNASKWYTHTAVQPAELTSPIGDQNCLKCHEEVTQRAGKSRGEGEMGHWHLFLSRWQASSADAASCVTCHSGHSTGSTAKDEFMNTPNVRATCNDCHRTMGD